jgi:hypothetical protein
MLDIWPKLPIYIHAIGSIMMDEERDDCIAALRLKRRVSGIRSSGSAWEAFVSQMQRPFPVLTHLWVEPRIVVFPPVISPSFLGGYAPCLQVLHLYGVPFPALPELLLSATNLVRLSYDYIPRSGYISPQSMVTGLSVPTGLESLSLTFRSLYSLEEEPIRIPPPHTHTLLPALTDLHLQGTPEYMENLVVQTDAPLLERLDITLFRQEVLQVSELANIVRRSIKPSLIDRAQVTFAPFSISIRLFQKFLDVDPNTLELEVLCHTSQFQLSDLVQLCVSCLPTPSHFKHLLIRVQRGSLQDVVDDLDPQWLELLCPFNNMKDLHLSRYVAPHVVMPQSGSEPQFGPELL